MQYKSTTHLLHLILTIIFFPWIIIWVWRASSNASHNRAVDNMKREEEISILRQIARNK